MENDLLRKHKRRFAQRSRRFRRRWQNEVNDADDEDSNPQTSSSDDDSNDSCSPHAHSELFEDIIPVVQVAGAPRVSMSNDVSPLDNEQASDEVLVDIDGNSDEDYQDDIVQNLMCGVNVANDGCDSDNDCSHDGDAFQSMQKYMSPLQSGSSASPITRELRQNNMIHFWSHVMQTFHWSKAEQRFVILGMQLAAKQRVQVPKAPSSMDKVLRERLAPFTGDKVYQTLYCCRKPTCHNAGDEVQYDGSSNGGTCSGCGEYYSTSGTDGRIVNFDLVEMMEGILTKTDAGAIVCDNIFDDNGDFRPQSKVPHGEMYRHILKERKVINGEKHCALGINLVSDGSNARGGNQKAYVACVQLPDLGVEFVETQIYPVAVCINSSGRCCKPHLTLFYKQLVRDLETLRTHPIKFVWKRPNKKPEVIYFTFLFNIYIADGQERNAICGMKATSAHFGCNQCVQRSPLTGFPWSHFNVHRRVEDFQLRPGLTQRWPVVDRSTPAYKRCRRLLDCTASILQQLAP